MNQPIPLAYWQAMLAIVDHGGYAQAAEALGKSQSSISYSIQKLEEQLGQRVFITQGRRAVPSLVGESLLERARLLVDNAYSLEAAAQRLGAGVSTEVRLAIDALFPDQLLLKVLEHFAAAGSSPRVNVLQTVLSGAEEALLRRSVDLAIAPRIPQGFTGEALMPIRLIAVAAPSHPLNQQATPLSWADLRPYRQLVIRDSGSQQESLGWLDAEQRWTFSYPATSIQAAVDSFGFAWYPELLIQDELKHGRLKPLELKEGRHRHAWLYRVFAHPEFPGAGCQALADSFDAVIAAAISDSPQHQNKPG